jgi:hypothetical protein
MSIFSSILDKLGLGKQAAPAPKPAAPVAPKPTQAAPVAPQPTPAAPSGGYYTPPPTSSTPKPFEAPPKPVAGGPPMGHTAPPAEAAPVAGGPPVSYSLPPTAPPPKPEAIPLVDVVAKLDAMAANRPEKLNWKVSIADLLYLLGMDRSLKARKELAEELGCPAELMGGDSSQMNIWLHKTVLRKLAENGGNIPKELLD